MKKILKKMLLVVLMVGVGAVMHPAAGGGRMMLQDSQDPITRVDEFVRENRGVQGAFFYAAESDKAEFFGPLIQRGASINAVKRDGWTRVDACTALYLAAARGYNGAVKVLLQLGVNVDAVDENGATALHMAAMNGHEGVVELLLEAGAKMDVVGSDGRTAWHRAVDGHHWDVVKCFYNEVKRIGIGDIDRFYKLSDKLRWLFLMQYIFQEGSAQNAFFDAVENNFEGIVGPLMEKEVDINAVDRKGLAALHKAVSNGHRGLVRFLVQAKANVEAVAQKNALPAYGETKFALLAQAQTQANFVDQRGWSALYKAAQLNHWDVVKLLSQAGAKLNHWDVIKLLLYAGAKLESGIVGRYTSFHAIGLSLINVYREQLERQYPAETHEFHIIKAQQFDEFIETALQCVCTNEKKHIVALLVQARKQGYAVEAQPVACSGLEDGQVVESDSDLECPGLESEQEAPVMCACTSCEAMLCAVALDEHDGVVVAEQVALAVLAD